MKGNVVVCRLMDQGDVAWKGFNVWFISIFSSQYQSVVKETGNENNEDHQSGVIVLMFC